MQSFKRPVIAIDIDLTVVDTLTPWLMWLDRRGLTFPADAFMESSNKNWLTHYDRMPEFAHAHSFTDMDKDELTKAHMDFWSEPKLYDLLSPVPGAVGKIRQMARPVEQGGLNAEIVFVSHCIAGHKDSKVELIKHFFARMNWDFVDTRAKHRVNYDVLIDDNPSIMQLCIERNPRAKHVMLTGIFFDAMLKRVPLGNDSLLADAVVDLGKRLPNVYRLASWEALEVDKLLG